MTRYISPIQKRATNSALVCILSAVISAAMSTMEEPLEGIRQILFILSLVTAVASFISLLYFSIKFSAQKKFLKTLSEDAQPVCQANPPSSINNQPDALIHTDSLSVHSDISSVDGMAGLDFEHWCANLLQNNSFVNVVVTQASGDQGVDILAEKDGIKYAIQCKCYSSDLGNTPVQEVNAGKEFYHCHVGAVMTNRYFTAGAKELAAATGVLLWDRDWIEARTPAPTSATFCADEDILITALAVVISAQQASVAMLQRRLNIGYAQAAKLIDTMEEKGYVGPFSGAKPREVFITEEQWQALRSNRH